ncbi:MAG: tRNA pseudouridine(55) synthase TruB [Chloroflexota bacterium]
MLLLYLMTMDQMLLVDKPRGLTSSQVVQAIKRKLKVKTGHTGTLDPLATGLLIILTGRRTRQARAFLRFRKSYEVKGVLGVETDTYDAEGKIVSQKEGVVTREEIEAATGEFRGVIWQTPPSYSSKKVKGKRAYELARKGQTPELSPNEVTVYSLELKDCQFPHFTLVCEVSSGFYVRSLVHDIGCRLRVGATVTDVRRTAIGPYLVSQAKSLDEILE